MGKHNITLVTLAVLSALASVARAATCSNYTNVPYHFDDLYLKTSPTTFVVSRGVVCNSTSDCSVLIGGFIPLNRTLNITADADIFTLITDTTNVTFIESLIGNATVSNNNKTLDLGTAGYYGFTPVLRCVQGILNDCQDGIENGTAVEACGPAPLAYSANDKYPHLQGGYNEVVTDVSTAEALTCNLANTTAAMNGHTPSNCSSALTGAAPSVNVGAVGFVSVATIVVLSFFSL